MTTIRLLPTLFTKILVNSVYAFCCLFFSVKNQKVTFASYRTNDLQGNLLYLYDELNRKHPEYFCKLLFKKFQSTRFGKISYLFHMLIAAYHLATSRYFFIDDFYMPVYLIKPRSKTEIIQVWHGAGAFKKFGYSTIGKTFGPNPEYLKYVKIHSNYSKVIVSSDEVIPYFAEAFNMSPKNVLPLGIPRTDFLFQKDKHIDIRKRLYDLYPSLKGKKIILYAPTFRGKSHSQTNFKSYLDLSAMKSYLDNDYALVVKLHPYMNSEVDGYVSEFVYHLDEDFTTEELLVISDVLITDYSSIIFDYSLLGRPIAFFANDIEEYMLERDFYYEYKSFAPGPIFSDTKELASWLNCEEGNTNKVDQFANRFFNAFDGSASERIIESIIQDDGQNS